MRGEIVHVDLLRVRMDETIQTTVALELVGAEEAPGVNEGGVLSQQVTRELNIEALPGDIPDSIDARRLRHGDQRHASRCRRVTAPTASRCSTTPRRP